MNLLLQAERERAMLIDRRNSILAAKNIIGDLEQAVIAAREALADAQLRLHSTGCDDAVLKLVQLYLDAATKDSKDRAGDMKKVDSKKYEEVNNSLAAQNLPPLTETQFQQLVDMHAACLEKQAGLSTAVAAHARAQLASELANSEGTQLQQQLMEQIDSITLDIESYNRVLKTAKNPPPEDATHTEGTAVTRPKGTAVPDHVILPGLDEKEGASVWQEIFLTYTANEEAESSLSATSLSHTDWRFGLFFTSAGGSMETPTSTALETYTAKNTSIKLGFRAMRVSIQRPWMNAALLGQTKDFYRTGDSDTPISAGDPVEVKKQLDENRFGNTQNALLPSWATGFVVAKDIHILMESTENFSSQFVSSIQAAAHSGGGFLCFSAARGDGSAGPREAAAVSSTGKTLSIKIPTPQILGWISELAPQDFSIPAGGKLPEDEFPGSWLRREE